MTIYCSNDPCETEATRVVLDMNDKPYTYLCETCTGAFEMGQENFELNIIFLEEQEEEVLG